MKNLTWAGILILSLLVSACGAQPTEPPISIDDIQQTSVAAASTIVAETQAAIPTNTPVPPTDAPTATPLPTETSLPAPTLDVTSGIPTIPATFTPQVVTSANGDICNQPLTSWQGPSASISIYNETKPKGDLILSLYVVTDLGECGYLYVYGDSFSGPVGQYSAGAFVTGKQNFKVFGGFRITEASWRIVVKNNSITALGGCYPNC